MYSRRCCYFCCCLYDLLLTLCYNELLSCIPQPDPCLTCYMRISLPLSESPHLAIVLLALIYYYQYLW